MIDVNEHEHFMREALHEVFSITLTDEIFQYILNGIANY